MELNLLNRTFSTDEAKLLNPLVLAFVGDAVFETVVRTYLVGRNTELSAHKLHLQAIAYVKAHSQSEFVRKIESILSEEELTIVKRGRNTKSATVPKNADVQEYRLATGFETLVGYLYLTNRAERLLEILKTVVFDDNKENSIF